MIHRRNSHHRRQHRPRAPPHGSPCIIQHDTDDLSLLTRPGRDIQRLDAPLQARRETGPGVDRESASVPLLLDGTGGRVAGEEAFDEGGRVLPCESDNVVHVGDLFEHASHPESNSGSSSGKDVGG